MMKQLYYVIQTLIRGRGSNVIKVLSLGMGLTMSILLFSRVAYEQSFDTCYRDYDRIYQAWSQFSVNGETMDWQTFNVGPLVGAILENFPDEVESAASTSTWSVSNPLYVDGRRFDSKKIAADSLFFHTMGINVLTGDARQGLTQPDVIFLSRSLAKEIFGDADPMGRTISYNHEFDLTVRGIYEDVADNTSLYHAAVVSMPTVFNRFSDNYSWQGGDSWLEYVRLRKDADVEAINRRLPAMIDKYRPKEKSYGYTAKIEPLRDTYRGYDNVQMMTIVMSVLGVCILFITALNYVLISISSLSYRAKQVGVHKCNGASEGTILSMFMLETLFIILAALVLMAVFVLGFRDFVEDTASADLGSLFAGERLWVPATVVLLLFLIGGLLPGWQMARIPVTQVFRRYTEGKKGWKRPLLFVQFAGVAFICGLMLVVSAQYRFVLDKDMGYRPERVAVGYLALRDSVARDAAYQYFKSLPYVEAVSSAQSTPLNGYSGMMILDEAGKSLFSCRTCYWAMPDFYTFMGMQLREGRRAREAGGQVEECLVNESFVEKMHWSYPVTGEHPQWVNASGTRLKVVGVLKDFQIGNFYEDAQPFISIGNELFYGLIHVRLKEPFAENLRQLNKDVAVAYPDKTIDFEGYEQSLAETYNSVRVFRNASLMAAVTMFFVMLMGLIGYTTDEVRRRSKEIAVRKVNGAEASDILRLLNKDVARVAVPSVIIGTLASWYVGEIWMDSFKVKLEVSWLLYGAVVLLVLAVIFGCVVGKSWRIANENPVDSIKSE